MFVDGTAVVVVLEEEVVEALYGKLVFEGPVGEFEVEEGLVEAENAVVEDDVKPSGTITDTQCRVAEAFVELVAGGAGDEAGESGVAQSQGPLSRRGDRAEQHCHNQG